ncbi:MAG: branched-chain amino acid ABC transporter permease [Dehalococcoidales bacterium]|nr:branched-chain amino acid ABC transporter permease [Dehalococcoidales bacterium]
MALPSGTFNQSYAQDMAIFRTKTQWILLFAFLAFLFTCPLYSGDRILTILTIIGITVISVHGLNILTGYCNQISIGHAGFMAVGAYTSGMLTAHLGWSFWAALPCAALMAGLVGILFGLPSLKVKGFYLIMATIAAQFIIIWFILQFRNITGGGDGLAVPRPEIGDFVFKSKASYFYLVMIFACLATFAATNIVRTRAGRAFIAIRDNELAAEVMGVNLWAYKLLAFFIGCVFAGVAGALLVHYVAFATVDQFPFMNSVWYLGMLIVGGMGSTAGVIFGVVSLKLLDELVVIVGPMLAVVVSPQAAASLSLIMRGLIIIIFLIFEPRGLAHRWQMVKAYYRLWPFSH